MGIGKRGCEGGFSRTDGQVLLVSTRFALFTEYTDLCL